jgi:hypothetical protein
MFFLRFGTINGLSLKEWLKAILSMRKEISHVLISPGSVISFFSGIHQKHRYNLMHYVQNGGGNWLSFNGILPAPVGNNEILWRDIYTRLQKGDDWIWVYAVARVKIRHNESNLIDQARFTSMGCESPMGSIDGKNFGGKCKLRGKLIAPEDLPFTP